MEDQNFIGLFNDFHTKMEPILGATLKKCPMIGGDPIPEDINKKVNELKAGLTIDEKYNLKDIFSSDGKLWSKLKSLRDNKAE